VLARQSFSPHIVLACDVVACDMHACDVIISSTGSSQTLLNTCVA
jgi:hypothetical protein